MSSPHEETEIMASKALLFATESLRPMISLERWFSRVHDSQDYQDDEDRTQLNKAIKDAFELIQNMPSKEEENVRESTARLLIHCAEVAILADLKPICE